jgi:hypothetical protein
MRSKRKMETVRIRKANATIKKEKVVCFACVHRIAHSNFSNREIINGTINWSSTSEGSDYWFGLYINTKK